MRRLVLSLPCALLALSACRDVLGPTDVAGIYVLERVASTAMPGEVASATYGVARVFYDTLELRRDGSARWSRHTELLPPGATDWVVLRGESTWQFTIRADEVRLRSDGCTVPGEACTLDISQTKVRVRGAQSLAAGSDFGPMVYARVGEATP